MTTMRPKSPFFSPGNLRTLWLMILGLGIPTLVVLATRPGHSVISPGSMENDMKEIKPAAAPIGCGDIAPLPSSPDQNFTIQKTPEQWKLQLTPQQYSVTRQKGTEPAFTGEYWNHKAQGDYLCVACGNKLFQSGDKFDSGTGWPSFTQPVEDVSLHSVTDASFGMVRTEVMCARCGAHLGHKFDDGPGEQGLRYCINSASLQFEKAP